MGLSKPSWVNTQPEPSPPLLNLNISPTPAHPLNISPKPTDMEHNGTAPFVLSGGQPHCERRRSYVER